jgi:antitoxin VapB
MTEFSSKQSKIQALLSSRGLDALLLQRVSSFAWATGGAASYINTAVSFGEASLLVAPSGLHLFTNNIEATRLEQEEGLKEQGWQFHTGPWFEPQHALQDMVRGLKLGADSAFPGAVDLSAEVTGLRIALTPEEGERFRQLGRLCAQAMDAAIKQVQPGQSEYELAALVGGELQSRGVQPIVTSAPCPRSCAARPRPRPASMPPSSPPPAPAAA